MARLTALFLILTAVALAVSACGSPAPAATGALTPPAIPTLTPTVVSFPDADLDAAMREVMGKTPDAEFLSTELATIENLDLLGLDIEDIRGLEYCVNLVSLDLGWNRITDITALVNRSRFSEGFRLVLVDNLLDPSEGSDDLEDINKLLARQVEVTY